MATDVERLLVKLEADITKYERAMARALGQTDTQARKIKKKFDDIEAGIGDALTAAATRFAGVVAASLSASLSIQSIAAYSDQWTELGNKLRGAGLDAGEAAAAQEKIVEIAQRSRAEIGSVGDLYAKLSLASRDLGASQADVAVATEVVTKAMKIGGAGVAETSSAVQQLGQALSSGTLQGDELRSLLENAPQLAQVLAKEFGVAVGELKSLGAEGQLAASRVLRAIISAAPQINRTFSQTNATFAESAVALKNAVLEFVGSLVGAIRESANHKAALDDERASLDALRESYGLLTSAQRENSNAKSKTETKLGNEFAATQGDIENLRTSLRGAIADLQQFGAIGVRGDEKARLIDILTTALNGDKAAADEAVVAIERLAEANPAAGSALSGIRALAESLGVVQRQAELAQSAILSITVGPGPAPYSPPKYYAGAAKAGEAQSMADSEAVAASILNDKLVSSRLDEKAAKVRAKIEDLRKDLTSRGLAAPGNLDAVASQIIANEDARRPSGGKSEADNFDSMVQRSEKRIAMLRLEQEAVGRTTFENARAAESLRLMEEAKQKDIELTPQQIQKINELATAYGLQKVASEQATAAQAASNEAAQFAGEAISGFLSDIVSGGKNAEEALMNLTKRLADAALQAVLLGKGPLGDIFGMAPSSPGGPGGLIGALFGGLAGAKAMGGPVSGGQPYLVGERGPEVVVPGRSGMVVPNNVLSRASSSPQGGITVVQNNSFAAGSDVAAIAKLLPEMKKVAVDSVRDAMARGKL